MTHHLYGLRVGIGLTGLGLGIGSVVALVTDTSWLTATAGVLMVIGATALAYIFIPDALPNAGASTTKRYTGVRSESHNTVGSSLAGGRAGIEPGDSSWTAQSLYNAGLPLVVAFTLIAVRLLLT